MSLIRRVAGMLAMILWPCVALGETPAQWRAWSLPGAEPLPYGARLRLGSGSVLSGDAADLSRDGRWLATADNRTCKLFERTTGKQVALVPAPQPIVGIPALRFTHDSRILVYGGDRQLSVLDVPSGKTLRVIDISAQSLYLDKPSFSQDGPLVSFGGLSSGPPEEAFVWDLATGKGLGPYKPEPGSSFLHTALSLDGKTLATWRDKPKQPQQIIQLWDVTTTREKRRLEIVVDPRFTPRMIFTPDGRVLVIPVGPELRFIDVASGAVRQVVGGMATDTSLLAYSPNGRVLFAAGFHGQLQAWHPDASRLRDLPRGPVGAQPVSLAFPAYGAPIVMGKIDNSLTWWDGASGAEAIPHHGHRGRLRGIAFSPRGNHVTTLAGDAQVITWDATTGALLRRLSLAEGDRSIFLFNRLSLSADGSLAAGIDGKDDRLRFWDLTTGKVARQVDIELWSSLNVDFSVTGAAIVARSVQGGAICWDSVTGRERGRIDPGSTVRSGEFALSPDGSLFARSFVDYDAETKRASGVNDVLGLPGARKLYALQHPTNSFFPALAFSTDGRLLAGAVNASVRNRGEHFVQLFDTRAGGEVKRLCPVQHDAKGLVSALVFAPDGRTLALALHMGQGGSETIIAVWELASGGLRHMFRGRQGRIEALAISADGATLASGGSDATVLLWETSGRPAAPAPLSPEALQAAWSDLASPDAGTGFRALGRLLGTPAQAVALLKQHLKPVAPVDVDETQVPRWLSELDSSDFARRDAARRSLAALGRRAEPALRKAQMVESTLEHRRQVESLLKLIDAQALSLREARALEVLERLREPESAAILASLAAGDASALLTHEARRVLARLRHE